MVAGDFCALYLVYIDGAAASAMPLQEGGRTARLAPQNAQTTTHKPTDLRQGMENDMELRYKALLTQHEATICHVCRLYSRRDSYHYAALYQEVALSLWRELSSHGFGRLQRRDREAAWVYRIAVNACINYCHSSEGRPWAVPLDEVSADSLPLPAQEEEDECWEHLAAALTDDERRLLQLLLQGYRYDEIAQREGLSTTAVGSRLSRIRRKLKEHHHLNERPQDHERE